jgi:mycothiol S-conjugate amidase
VRAFPRAGDPSSYPEQLAPEHGGTAPAEGGLAPWTPSKLYEQATPASVRTAMRERLQAMGERGWWEPPEDATPEQLEAWEDHVTKMLVPDDQITTRIDVGGYLDAKWRAMQRHVTQISTDFAWMKLGLEAWREVWGFEAYILRESGVESAFPETDLFAGIS